MNTDPRENGYEKAEQWIDDALAEYARAEPRSGFQGRVLVRLRLAEGQTHQNGWWRWAFAIGAAAMCLLALLWLGHLSSRQVSKTQITNGGPTAKEAAAKASERIEPLQQRRRGPAKVKTIPAPKQEQFPAVLPLSDQERMLARYVRDFPEKAALVARAQTDLHKLNDLEMNTSRAAADSNHSDSQE